MPRSCLLLLLALLAAASSSSAASGRSLRQSVSGCTGSVVNTLIGRLSTQVDAQVSKALTSNWPAAQSSINNTLAHLNISLPIVAPSVPLKKCVLGVCLGFTAKLNGTVHVSNGTLSVLKPPTVQLTNLTCAPPANALSLTANTSAVTSFKFTASSLKLHVSGNIKATTTSVYFGLTGAVPVGFDGVLTIKGLTGQAQVHSQINATYALKGATLSYSLAIISVDGVKLGFTSATFIPLILPPAGAATAILTQIEDFVTGLVMTNVDNSISRQLEAVLNSQLGTLRYKGSIKV